MVLYDGCGIFEERFLRRGSRRFVYVVRVVREDDSVIRSRAAAGGSSRLLHVSECHWRECFTSRLRTLRCVRITTCSFVGSLV
jgi:hypothetical protein